MNAAIALMIALVALLMIIPAQSESTVLCSITHPNNFIAHSFHHKIMQNTPYTLCIAQSSYAIASVIEVGVSSEVMNAQFQAYGLVKLQSSASTSLCCDFGAIFVMNTPITIDDHIIGNIRYIYPGYQMSKITGIVPDSTNIVIATRSRSAPEKTHILDGEEYYPLPNPQLLSLMVCNSKEVYAIVGEYAGISVYANNGSLITTVTQNSAGHPWNVMGCEPNGFYITRGSDTNLSSIEYYQL